MTGQTISHYQIGEKLGSGGMGVVYRAEDTKLRRDVALKFLPQISAADEDSRARFLMEARAAAALNHPNICTVYEVDEEHGFLAMELVEGETVEARRKRRPLPLDEVLNFALQVCNGLQAAHEKGIIHRDIKSSNLMVTGRGAVKIMDFGLARLSTTTRLTRTGMSVGTPGYMAPEMFESAGADARSDVWSFGVVLHEVVAGSLPFPGDSDAAIMFAVMNKDPEPLSALRAGVPLELDRIVKKALAKKPDDRYQHVEDLAADLRALQRAGSPAPVPTKPPRPKWAVAAITVAALSAAGVFIWWQQSRMSRERTIQQVATLADRGAMIEAYRLARMLDDRNPNDPAMKKVWDTVGPARPLTTDPPGADVYIRDYMKPESEWLHIGKTPIESARLPLVMLRIKMTKDGFADSERALRIVGPLAVKLTRKEANPPGMVLILGTGRPYQSAPLDDFWLDKYETTNAEYKKFVDAGGYQDHKFWKQPFVDGSRQMSWEEAMKRFLDSTGRPGPAKWELGAYPEGAENLPVTGVSWYEAAAYAEFMGKELPTVQHWRQAALYQSISSEVVQLSNFAGKGPAAPGKFQGTGFFGTYDLAGNVKEWGWNASAEKRLLLGGAWNEPDYAFTATDGRPPFDRAETFGFRCARYTKPITDNLKAPIVRQFRDYSAEKPVSDEQFQAFRSFYEYDKSALDSKREATDDSDEHWKVEKLTFNAAYGNERVIAYLYLPRKTAPPYQTVVHFPAGYAPILDRIDAVGLHWIRYIVQSGRALMYPIYKGTYERRLRQQLTGPLAYRDLRIQQCKDISRSIDYLETRPDIDRTRLAYQGFSLGVVVGQLCLAEENRFRTAIFQAGGMTNFRVPPEIDPINFAPRIRIPVLLINGRNDFDVPVKELQEPLFRWLGSPPGGKKHFVVEGGHVVPRRLVVKESLDWLDKYLGPVALSR